MQELFYNRHVLIYSLLVAVAACLAMAVLVPTGKWITTAGLLLDVTGLVQLGVSGLFSRSLEAYADEEKYPYGPPSPMMREMVKEHHENEVLARVKHNLFMEPHTGFVIIVAGCLVQLIGAWL